MKAISNKWRGQFTSTTTGDILQQVILRLVRPTCRHRPGYKIIACHGPARRRTYDDKREAATIEEVGYFDDCLNSQGKRICLLDIAKIRHYIAHGAEPTIPVWKLLGASGAFPIHPKLYAFAAKNQYLQQILPQDEPSKDTLIEYPDSHPTYYDNRREYEPWDIETYEGGASKTRMVNDHMKISSEDRDNRMKGNMRIGDYKQLVAKLDELEDLSPIQRRMYEHMFVKAFWDLNHYDDTGRGLHENFGQTGYAEKAHAMQKSQYWYWTRGVRRRGFSDPFQLAQKPEIRRPGENADLLKSINPA